jgi:GT2 family glycosyltransferase
MASVSPWPRVLVIVLNWNGTDDTLACLASLAAVDYPAFTTLVIDNGSRVSCRAAVRQHFPETECLDLPMNLGYAGGNDAGLRRAIADGYAYAYVLNNDTVVEPDFLRAAVAAASTVGVAAVGGKVLCLEDPDRLWMTYGRVTWRQSLIGLEGWGERDRGQYDEQKDVEWVPGCGLLLSCAALEDVGLFDERFFAYHEDVDWCTRARAAGWRVVYAPSSVVHHRGHRSLGGPGYNSPRKYLSARNSVLYARKHGTRTQRWKLGAAVILTLPFVVVRRLVTGDLPGVVYKVRGWIDGLRDREPPYQSLGLR